MNNKVLLIAGVVLTGAALFAGGLLLGSVNAQEPNPDSFLPGWMMGNRNGQIGQGTLGTPNQGYGMMGSGATNQGFGMMGGGMMGSGTTNQGYGMMGGGMMGSGTTNQGFGMMGGGMMGSGATNQGYGMMGSFGVPADVEPLTIEAAETAVSTYLASLADESLSIGEIMIFDNHAYAQVVDSESGIGAFELLVDPVTGAVYPEPGPNMMWNLEYGHMGGINGQGYGMMGGGMMGGFGYQSTATTTISGSQAIELAQAYLDEVLPGKRAGETADAFPGYYTIHIEEDGEITGMLSIHAATGQVFLHNWHGTFVEMSGEVHLIS